MTPLHAANLIVNGGFEATVLGVGNVAVFASGSTGIPGWLVTGACGSNCIVQLDSAYTEFPTPAGIHFLSEEGNQHIDLTGSANSLVGGVQQTVATTAGVSYQLSFWVGNMYDFAPAAYTQPSSLQLLIDGVSAGVYLNADNTVNQTNWIQFTVGFTAASSSTSISFVNATPLIDNYVGLDNVVLVADANVGAATPEPSTWVLGLSAVVLGFIRRRCQAPNSRNLVFHAGV